MNADNPWEASRRSVRPGWHREWQLLLFVSIGTMGNGVGGADIGFLF